MTAPRARTVDMLTGQKAPTQFFKALSEASEFIRQCDGADDELRRLAHDNDMLRQQNYALLCRVDELQAEDDAKAELIGQLKAERDRLRTAVEGRRSGW